MIHGRGGTARPLLLDLFCCEGGAATGYHAAGFDVIGVDIAAQPRYPFPMVQADALQLPFGLERFAAIHASPPCQSYSQLNQSPDTYPRLIEPIREMLEASGKPYVIENVMGARAEMRDPLKLCATAFGSPIEGAEMHRHRLFESNVLMMGAPRCAHDRGREVLGVYGSLSLNQRVTSGKRGGAPRMRASRSQARVLMGMPWASDRGLAEAIPPAYTQWIGEQLAWWI